MIRMFQQIYLIPGTLAANHALKVKMPTGATLVHVSLSQTAANIGTLKIGSASDDDAYLTATNFPNNDVTEVATPAGFAGVAAGGQYPHLMDGDTLMVTITDHASHMANVCVVLTFQEG